MAQPVEKLTLEELQAENKALHRKKAEATDRQALISAEVARRMKQRKADYLVAALGVEELEVLQESVDLALRRALERKAAANASP